MVDEFQAMREAWSRKDLRRAYALWMAEHTDAYAWELRQARDEFRARRRTLRLSRPPLPEDAAPGTDHAAWLAAWAVAEHPSRDLAHTLLHVEDATDRGRGRGSLENLLAAREQWLALKQAPDVPPTLLSILERRLLAPAEQAQEHLWEAGPEARRLARLIRDDYPLVLECEPAFFRRHLPPPALESDVAGRPPPETRAGLFVQRLVGAVAAVALVLLLGRGCFERMQTRDRQLEDALENQRSLDDMLKRLRRTRAERGDRPSFATGSEIYETILLANRRDATETEILAHFERFGRTEAGLRKALAEQGSLDGSYSLGARYGKLLARLDALRGK